MSKFKVGDRVKRIRDTEFPDFGYVRKGFVGTVTGITSGCIKLDDERGAYNRSCDFELAPQFTINAGDYIDSREFTREECERFCEIAVECGFNFIESNGTYGKFESGFNYPHLTHIGVGQTVFEPQLWWESESYWINMNYNNITTKFRKFLDKEKGMKEFTKDDLKDGMRLLVEDADEEMVVVHGVAISNTFATVCEGRITLSGSYATDLSKLSDDMVTGAGNKVLRVTERDGTVLFERKPEKVKLELEVTPEQAEAIRKQLNQ